MMSLKMHFLLIALTVLLQCHLTSPLPVSVLFLKSDETSLWCGVADLYVDRRLVCNGIVDCYNNASDEIGNFLIKSSCLSYSAEVFNNS